MRNTKDTPIFLAPSLVSREWLWSFALIALVLLAEFVGFGGVLRGLGERILNPVLVGTQQVMTSVTWPVRHLQNLTTAQRRIQDLERRYAEASAELGSMAALQTENEALRNMMQASDVKLEQRVITTPIVSYGRPLIAGGRQEGIEEGAMVLISQTLVGRVTSVSEHQAEISLLSHLGSEPVLARTESGIDGVIRGDDKRVLLTEVPINQKLIVGERVVTQGQDGIGPNLYLGRIASITSRPESAVQTAVVEQLVSFFEATVVEIR